MKIFTGIKYLKGDNNHTPELISIGMISEDHQELYLINSECNFTKATEVESKEILAPLGLVDQDVNNSLCKNTIPFMRRIETIRDELRTFFSQFTKVEIYLSCPIEKLPISSLLISNLTIMPVKYLPLSNDSSRISIVGQYSSYCEALFVKSRYDSIRGGS